MAGDQRYVIDESVQYGYVGRRDVATLLPFLVPHLQPGIEASDVGCGVGAIAERPDAFATWLYCGALGWVD